MNHLLHLGSVIQVRFGRLDGEDVLPVEPITLPIERFTIEEWTKAYDLINERRGQLEAAIDQHSNGGAHVSG